MKLLMKTDYDEADDNNDDESDDEALYSLASRKQITSKSVCGVCGGRGHYGRVDGMDCLTKQLGITIPRSELMQTRYPSGITFPFTDPPRSSAGSYKTSHQGANLASSSRSAGKSKRKPFRPNPKSPKPSHRFKPKRVSQVDEHDSEHMEHEERVEHDEGESSEGDPKADFASLAITYSTIDIRDDARYASTDESSDDSHRHRRRERPH
jgi:hypothetical protein